MPTRLPHPRPAESFARVPARPTSRPGPTPAAVTMVRPPSWVAGATRVRSPGAPNPTVDPFDAVTESLSLRVPPTDATRHRPPPAHPAPAGLPASGSPTPSAASPALAVLAALALVVSAVALLLPWARGARVADPGPLGVYPATSPIGVMALTVLGVLLIPVAADLVARSHRWLGLVAVPPLVLLTTTVTLFVGTAVDGRSPQQVPKALGLPVILAQLGPGAWVFLAAQALAAVVGTIGAVHFARARAATEPAFVSPRRTAVLALCAVASIAVVGTTVAVVASGEPSPSSTTTVAAPPAFTGSTGTLPGGSSATPAATGSSGTGSFGTGTPSAVCPAEAAATMPEQVGALVVGRSPTVHIAVCQGASGRLYYYGANDRTRLTTTLPAERAEDSWIVTNKGVTYAVTENSLSITRGSQILAEETLRSGW